MKSEIRICPKCGKEFSAPPALSRQDNQTFICSDCGTKESLEAMGISAEEQEKILSIIHSYSGGTQPK